ncbi:MAG: DUF2283 domain-containing protein [Verrucomicrobia bacterium]|nr:DUF2283 domain-containing protein [Verrucomicrobiota bacterium]
MKIKYFEDTDTLLITLLSHDPVETEDLDENTLIDFDEEGNVCSITIEHAQKRIGDTDVHFERVPKKSRKRLVSC